MDFDDDLAASGVQSMEGHSTGHPEVQVLLFGPFEIAKSLMKFVFLNHSVCPNLPEVSYGCLTQLVPGCFATRMWYRVGSLQFKD